MSLKPCPNRNCEGGSDYLRTESLSLVTPTHGRVRCDWCGLQGPIGDGAFDIEYLWNHLPREDVR